MYYSQVPIEDGAAKWRPPIIGFVYEVTEIVIVAVDVHAILVQKVADHRFRQLRILTRRRRV